MLKNWCRLGVNLKVNASTGQHSCGGLVSGDCFKKKLTAIVEITLHIFAHG